MNRKRQKYQLLPKNTLSTETQDEEFFEIFTLR